MNRKNHKRIGFFYNLRYIEFPIVILLIVLLTQNFLAGVQASQNPSANIVGEIEVPYGCIRIQTKPNSFSAWLRRLPLKNPESRIRLYNGKRKWLQGALYRVIDLPVGNKDLQQCADVAIRLRSDYLLSAARKNEIAFNFTSGDRALYSDWIAGYRPIVRGNNVSWKKISGIDSSFDAYQDYLNAVFMYAGSYSLSRELKKVNNTNNIVAGNCFIEGGFPGHVIIIVDVAIDTLSNDKYILLAQGFTPAQDIHVIRNPINNEIDPWFKLGEGSKLITMEWDFKWTDIYSFE